MGEARWVWVTCPECMDRNRAARRACKRCQRTGKVLKSVPISEERSDG